MLALKTLLTNLSYLRQILTSKNGGESCSSCLELKLMFWLLGRTSSRKRVDQERQIAQKCHLQLYQKCFGSFFYLLKQRGCRVKCKRVL